MTYQVLARRWRPLTFEAVVGQAPIVRTLRNALAQERIAHAYLFAAACPKSHVAGNAGPSPVEEALSAVNPDELTPKAALEALYRLKELARKDRE